MRISRRRDGEGQQKNTKTEGFNYYSELDMRVGHFVNLESDKKVVRLDMLRGSCSKLSRFFFWWYCEDFSGAGYLGF